jgi:ketosteroid isomerase-like protein
MWPAVADARSLVETYFRAWQAGDFAVMRSTLDDDLAFTGPIDTFGSADAFMQSVQGLSQIKEDLVIRKVWAAGPDVLVWYDLHTAVAPPVPVAEWHHAVGGKVTMVRAVFDPRPFTAPGAP